MSKFTHIFFYFMSSALNCLASFFLHCLAAKFIQRKFYLLLVDLIRPLDNFLHCWKIKSVHWTFLSLLVLDIVWELSWFCSSNHNQCKPINKKPKEQKTKCKLCKGFVSLKWIGHRSTIYGSSLRWLIIKWIVFLCWNKFKGKKQPPSFLIKLQNKKEETNRNRS